MWVFEKTEREPGQEPLWHRLPGETMKAYQAFLLYCRLGPERTIEEVRRQYRNSSQVAIWAKKWRWQERAAAYDAEQERLAMETLAAFRAQNALGDLMLLRKARDRIEEAVETLDPRKAMLRDIAFALRTVILCEQELFSGIPAPPLAPRGAEMEDPELEKDLRKVINKHCRNWTVGYYPEETGG